MDFPICGSDIYNLIPQRPPMLMIGSLLSSSSIEAITSFQIGADCIFVEDGKLTEFGLIENMAQSAAALNGINEYINKIPPRLGFIGEIKDFRLHKNPHVGDTIVTHIKIIAEADKVLLVDGKVRLKNVEDILANTKLKIFIQDAS